MQKSVWWNFFRSHLKHCDYHDPYRETPMCNFSGEASRILRRNSHPYLTHPLGFAAFQTATKTEDLSRSKNRGESWSLSKNLGTFRPIKKVVDWHRSGQQYNQRDMLFQFTEAVSKQHFVVVSQAHLVRQDIRMSPVGTKGISNLVTEGQSWKKQSTHI